MCILHCIPFYYLVLLMSMWEVYKKDFADSTVVSLKKKRKIMAATVEKNRAMLDCSCSRKEQCVEHEQAQHHKQCNVAAGGGRQTQPWLPVRAER